MNWIELNWNVNHDVILFSRFVMQSPCSYCSIKFLTEFETRCSPFGWRVCHHRFSYNYFQQTCQLNLGSSVCVVHVVTLIVLHCTMFVSSCISCQLWENQKITLVLTHLHHVIFLHLLFVMKYCPVVQRAIIDSYDDVGDS